MKLQILSEAGYSTCMSKKIVSVLASLKDGDLVSSRSLSLKVGTSFGYFAHCMSDPLLRPYRVFWHGQGNKYLWGNKRTIKNYKKVNHGPNAHL